MGRVRGTVGLFGGGGAAGGGGVCRVGGGWVGMEGDVVGREIGEGRSFSLVRYLG